MAAMPTARPRALGLLRHSLAAAGLGLGWLLLSGPAASAWSDPLGTGGLLDAPLAPVSSLAAPLVESVEGTTTALATTVESFPTATEPLLTGPLEPLAPVVGGLTSDVGEAVTTVGDVLGDTVSAPLPVAEPPSAPALPGPLAPLLPAPDLVMPPVPATVPEPAPVPDAAASPLSGAARPESDAALTAVDLPSAGDATRTTVAVRAWAGSMLGHLASVPAELSSTAGHTPAGSPGTPGGPWIIPLLDRHPWLGSGLTGSSGAGFTGTAMLSAAFMLPALLLLTVRKRTSAGPARASPAFDPGSTPD